MFPEFQNWQRLFDYLYKQWSGGWGALPPSDNFSGVLNFKGGAKIRNCQCEMLYKICKIQLVNKFKDTSNSGISI